MVYWIDGNSGWYPVRRMVLQSKFAHVMCSPFIVFVCLNSPPPPQLLFQCYGADMPGLLQNNNQPALALAWIGYFGTCLKLT